MNSRTVILSISLATVGFALFWWLGDHFGIPKLTQFAMPLGLGIASIPVIAQKIHHHRTNHTRVAVEHASEHPQTQQSTHSPHRSHQGSARSCCVYERAFAGSIVSAVIIYAVSVWAAWPTWVLGLGILLAMACNYWFAVLFTRPQPQMIALHPKQF